MKVSLVNPPQTELREPKAYIPLGLAYIGSSILNEINNKNSKFGLSIFNKNKNKNINSNIDVKVENLANSKEIKFKYGYADIFFITYSSASKIGVKNTINYIRDNYLDSKIVLGGPHPTVEPFSTYSMNDVNYVVTGEAENLVNNLIRNYYFQKNGVYCAGIINDLNTLPFPARELFDINDVVSISGIHSHEKGVRSTTMISSRGCPYNCFFCCKNHAMYTNYRFRSAENVRDEIKQLDENYCIDHIRFVDDCFTLNKERIKKLCKYTKKLKITFMCITRADVCGEEMLKLLKAGGCTTVDIGVETASDSLLKDLNKNETSDQMKRCILKAKGIGLKTKVFLQYNLPGETESDIEKTLEFLKKTKPDYYTLSKFVPLPGSMWENKAAYKNDQLWFYDDNDEKRKYLIDRIDDAIK